jgi:Uncharacterized conserved protein
MKQKLWILLSGLLVVGLLAACSSSPAVAATAAAGTPRTLVATGTGEVYITPDIAYINVGIHTEADTVTAALSDNNTQAKAITDTLTGMGVDVKDIQTTSFNVSPMTNYANDGSISRKYYAVDNSVYVTVRDLSALGKLLDAVVASGANTINGITFDVKDKNAANEKARDLAIQQAKTDAASIAKSAGVSLGDLQNISINTGGSTVYPMYDSAKAIGGGAVPVSAGQLLISVDATLTYIIK